MLWEVLLDVPVQIRELRGLKSVRSYGQEQQAMEWWGR